MSRSYHRTRQHFWGTLATDYGDEDLRKSQLERIARELEKKRLVKNQIRQERRRREPIQPVSPEAIPIHVKDESPLIHYPAGPADVLEMMRRIPAGVIDGLASVTLCLGAHFQSRSDDDQASERDPLVGRPGIEILPHIYCGNCLGIYQPGSAQIRLFAYVYDHQVPDREMWEFFLRLQMLSTLVHELAHHQDFATRMARGRWLGLNEEKVEHYADRVQYDWVDEYVVPYLRDAYPDALQTLESWMQYHGGVTLPLVLISGQWRWSAESGMVRVYFGSAKSAFLDLAENVYEQATRTRLEFAKHLHYGENYREALEIIDRILARESDCLDALTLQADIYEHQNRIEDAEAIARRVVELDAEFADAWKVLMDVYESQRQWEKLIAAAESGLQCVEEGGFLEYVFRRGRAFASLYLRDFSLLEQDIAALSEQPQAKHDVPVLQALLYLVRARFEEAYETAIGGMSLSKSSVRRVQKTVLVFVAHEAALQLEGETELPELEQVEVFPYARRILESCGYPWCEEVRTRVLPCAN